MNENKINWEKLTKKQYENYENLAKNYIDLNKKIESNQLPNFEDLINFMKLSLNDIIFIIDNNHNYNNQYINSLINLIMISIINIDSLINKRLLNIDNKINIKHLELIIKSNSLNNNLIYNKINNNNINKNNITIIKIYDNQYLLNEQCEKDKTISIEQHAELINSLKTTS